MSQNPQNLQNPQTPQNLQNPQSKSHKIVLKDVVFLAILSVIFLLCSSLVMPVVMFTQIFALRNLFGAFFFGIFAIIALERVPKLGALTLVGFFTGAFLGFMSIIMFINNFLGAVITEALVFLFFRGYNKRAARFFAAVIYPPLTVPLTLLANLWIKGKSFSEQLQNPTLDLLIIVGTFVIAVISALLGEKIAKELRRAGKL